MREQHGNDAIRVRLAFAARLRLRALPSVRWLPLILFLLLVAQPVSAAFLTFVEVHKDGVGGADGLGGTFAVTISPDGKHVYSAGLDGLAVFSRNATTGALTFVEALKDSVGGVDGLGGARSVTVSPDSKHVYAAGESDNAVAVFSRNPTTGRLTFVEALKDGVGGVDGLGHAFSVTASPDGKQMYVAGQNDNAVAVFSRNPTTGRLTFAEALKDGVGGVDGLGGARSVASSPDGLQVYVAGESDNAVAVFSRNLTTGRLTFAEVVRHNLGVDDLAFARWVRASPDSRFVYAAGINTVVVFSRSTTTGALTFVEVLRDGAGGVDGLNGVGEGAISPNGRHVYIAGGNDDAVAVFSRDPATGRLTFVEALTDGSGNVDGLDFVQSVAASPDSHHIYTGAALDNAVAVFRAAVSVYLPQAVK